MSGGLQGGVLWPVLLFTVMLYVLVGSLNSRVELIAL